MHNALLRLFEESVYFALKDGTPLDGGVFIGETEFLPLNMLRADPEAYESEAENWLNEVWKPAQEELRAQILSMHSNRRRYLDLKSAVEREQVIPFIGSGMSVESGLPTWPNLLRRMLKGTHLQATTLEELLREYKYEEAADLLASSMNKNLFDEGVDHNLSISIEQEIKGAIRFVPALLGNIVATTNLDNIQERYCAMIGCPFDHVLAGHGLRDFRRLRSAKERFLLKLHGHHARPETRVLGTAEYEQIYGSTSEVKTELSLLFQTHSLLFLGCSLGPDRTMKLIADVGAEDCAMPKHYAFMQLPATDHDRIEREEFLAACHIYPIWYASDHDECITALLAGLKDNF